MQIKEFESKSRYFLLEVPKVIKKVPGVKVFGRTLRSFLFSTDIALISNTDADAVMAVYPFSSQPVVNNTIVRASGIPVFCGLGGNLPHGRAERIAVEAEFNGAYGIIFSPQVDVETIAKVKNIVDIPVIFTVVSPKENLERKLECGVDMFNVSGAEDTCTIVQSIRQRFPYVPIIATGGPTDESIKATIECGADAITFTPPSNADIFRMQMQVYRDHLKND